MATQNQQRISMIADAFMSLTLSDQAIRALDGSAARLLRRVKDAAALLRNSSDVVPFTDEDVPRDQGEQDAIKSVANSVMEVADDISSFVARAKSSGFAPPSNPILEIIRFNKARRLKRVGGSNTFTIEPSYPSAKLSDDLMFNLNIFLDLLNKEKEGSLDLEKRSRDQQSKSPQRQAAQLSSYSMSLSGFDMVLPGSQADLLSFLPDVDKIKRKRIRQALGSLDFRKREPRLLFTANYDPDGISRGCVIGWVKIPDASGYTITRHSIFDNEDTIFEFSNKDVVSEYDAIKEYVNEWILSFYDQFDSERITGFLDKTIKSHNFYTYTLKAYQNIRTDKNFVFTTDVSQFIMSSLQIADIRAEMQDQVNNTIGKKIKGASADDISPYPFLSKKYYGHDKFDWILAAANVKSAIERGDSRSQVRAFSYLGSKLSFVEDQIANHKFYRPTNPNEIISNIKESINTFGLSQTIIEVIESTGLDLFFGPKETPQEEGFQRARSSITETDLGDIGTILSSIDPETATVDMSVLTTNLLNILQGTNTQEADESSSPTEIDVPEDITQEEFAEDPLQFVGKFDPGEEILDLATFEGLSSFVRTIRLFFDMSPNRTIFKARSDDASNLIDDKSRDNGKMILNSTGNTVLTTQVSTEFDPRTGREDSGTDPKGGNGGFSVD